jgi:hypothetical protein
LCFQEADPQAETTNFSAVRNFKTAQRQIPKLSNAHNQSLEKFNSKLIDNFVIFFLSY